MLAFSLWRSVFKDGHYYYTSRSVCCTTSRVSCTPQDMTVLNRHSRKANHGEREARKNPRIAQQGAKPDRRKIHSLELTYAYKNDHFGARYVYMYVWGTRAQKRSTTGWGLAMFSLTF